MSIILNERAWAEEAITYKSLGKKPSETLLRVARYYFDEQYSRQEVRKQLEAFLIQCDKNASVVAWADTLRWAVATAAKFPMAKVSSVTVTKGELDTIAVVSSRQAGRLAFTLLCASKYWDAVNPKNNHWVNEKDVEIMRMANMRPTIRRQSQLFAELRDLGLIRFSNKVDNLNVQVLFSEEGGEAAMEISDFRNIGFQYLKQLGEPFIKCACCGLTIRADIGPGRPRKYCDACAAQRKIEQSVNSVMRKRSGVTGK